MGRPSKINNLNSLAEEMLKFFYTAHKKLHTDKLPVFLTSFAIHKRISRNELYNYTRKSKKFNATYKECKDIIEEILKIGLAKSYFAPGPGIFIAKNETEMKDIPLIDNSKRTYLTNIKITINDNTDLPLAQESGNRLSKPSKV